MPEVPSSADSQKNILKSISSYGTRQKSSNAKSCPDKNHADCLGQATADFVFTIVSDDPNFFPHFLRMWLKWLGRLSLDRLSRHTVTTTHVPCCPFFSPMTYDTYHINTICTTNSCPSNYFRFPIGLWCWFIEMTAIDWETYFLVFLQWAHNKLSLQDLYNCHSWCCLNHLWKNHPPHLYP